MYQAHGECYISENSKTPANSRKIILSWNSYEDGTYNLVDTYSQHALCQITVGTNGRYRFFTALGVSGDYTDIVTQYGTVTLTWGNGTVTISGTTANSRIRQISVYNNFILQN